MLPVGEEVVLPVGEEVVLPVREEVVLPVREEYVLPVLFLFRPIPAGITSGHTDRGKTSERIS